MKMSYEDHDTISVLTLSGELTVDQADTFRRACQERFEAGVRDCVIDLEYLNFIDSAGLELLLWLVDEAGDRKGKVKLVSPDESVRKILQMTRLDRRFDIHETIESAAKSLR